MTIAISLVELPKIFADNLIQIIDNDITLSATGVNTDTRQIKTGNIFIALVGEKFDGHDFVDVAIQEAIAIVVDRQLKLTTKIPQFIVKDTLNAYRQIARWWRNRFSIPVIGITGSVGKTSTKELIAAVLSKSGKVLKTEKNYNNEIGVPKTLLEITPEHDYAVIEMAMRGKGEIALLTQIARPTIGVITNVGTAHIGRLGSKQAIADAKCELLATMSPKSTAILNHDNQLLIDTAASVWKGKTITYGLKGGDITGKLIDTQTIQIGKESYNLPIPGEHNASNLLAAIAVAQTLHLDLAPLKNLTVELPQGRARRYQLDSDILLLDETYNAGLESMQAALKLLKETPGNRHIAVLGTMKELGDYSDRFHYQIGETVRDLGIDLLLVLADEPATREIIKGAASIEAECFTEHQALTSRLQKIIASGDRILFKASNSVGLNRVVKQLQNHQFKYTKAD